LKKYWDDEQSGVVTLYAVDVNSLKEASLKRRIADQMVGLQVINAKVGQYGRSHYCARRLEIEIPVRV
jgi:hypothetical protein